MSISNNALRSMLNNMINENVDQAQLDLHQYLKMSIQSQLGLTEDVAVGTTFNTSSTRKEADKIASAIKDRFSVSVELSPKKDGSIEIKANNGSVVSSSDNSPYVFNAKNLSDTIDEFYRAFRQKRWMFTQPVRGIFTIGVTE